MLLLAVPGTQILDLVGPLQVFVRAAEIPRADAFAPRIYSVEVVTTQKGLLPTNCGLRLEGHGTYRQVRGPVDTLLIAGGAAVEDGMEDAALIRWLHSMSSQVRRLGSILYGIG